MPIYEFECRECHKVEEILQKVSDPVPEECPSCHKQGTLQKRVSHTSFQLKGGGWYNDLYASTKPSNESVSTPAKSEATAKSEAPVSAPAATTPTPTKNN